MYRLVETSESIREAMPAELAPVFWVVTAFGSPSILLGVLWFAYWNWDERRRAMLTVVGVAFVALALTLGLKEWLTLARPPADVVRYPIEPGGYGFPSGHAVSSAVVYGGALLTTGYYRRPRIAIPAVLWVGLIGLSRVFLGVHYLGDVVVGFAVGLLVLAALLLVLEHRPARLFAIAAVIAVAPFVMSEGSPDAALALGGSLGSLAAMVWLTEARREHSFRARHERVRYTVAGVVAVGLALAIAELTTVAWPIGLVLYAALGFCVLVLPTLPRLFEQSSLLPGST